jgi:hypothetical protein
MPLHSDRRMTLRWAKIGSPSGSQQRARWRRRVDCTGYQPALHAAPIQRAFCCDDDASR